IVETGGIVSSTGGTMTQNAPTTVYSGGVASFTLAPSSGYNSNSVTGTCGGTLVGNTFTTGRLSPSTNSCTVIANFTPVTVNVTSALTTNQSGTSSTTAGGTIIPSPTTTATKPVAVSYNGTTSFKLTVNSGYNLSSVTGNGSGCSTGTLVGLTYTTGAITSACTVTAIFTKQLAGQEVTVTSAVAGGTTTTPGTILPKGDTKVESGGTLSFTISPPPGYHIASMGALTGTTDFCAHGTLSGSTFTVGHITSTCSVQANFAPATFTITPVVTGGTLGGTISPSTPVTGSYTGTETFTLTQSK